MPAPEPDPTSPRSLVPLAGHGREPETRTCALLPAALGAWVPPQSSEQGNRIRTHTAPPCGGVPYPQERTSTQLTHATKMIHKIITRFTYSPSPVTRTIIWKFRSHIVTDKQWDVRKTRASSPPLPPPPGERARGGTAWKSVCHRVSFGDYKHVRNVELLRLCV